MCRQWETLENLALNGMSLGDPSKAWTFMQKRWKDSKSQSPGSEEETSYSHNRADANINNIHMACINSSQTKSSAWTMGRRYKVIHLTRKLLVIDSYWDRGNQFSPIEQHWVYQPHSRSGLMFRRSWLIQNELHIDLFFHGFVIFWRFFVVISFCFDFLFLYLCIYRQKKMWIG